MLLAFWMCLFAAMLTHSVQTRMVTCKMVIWHCLAFRYEDMHCSHTKTCLLTVRL